MPAFPSDVELILTSGVNDDYEPNVREKEMERGPPVTVLLGRRVNRKITVVAYFKTRESAEAFEDWFFNDIKQIEYFDFVNPKDGKTYSGQITEGYIGKREPASGGFHVSQRTFTIRYMT